MTRASRSVLDAALAVPWPLLAAALLAPSPPASAQCTANEIGKCNSAEMSEAGAFGAAVSLNGNVLAIGSPQDDTNGSFAGAVFVHRYNGAAWVEETKLTPSDGDSDDQFGHAVAVFGDTIVVGTPYDEPAGPYSGSAYVFQYDGSSWIQGPKLVAFDGALFDNFGFSVAIFDDAIVVGAPPADGHGAAYVFRRNAGLWTPEQKLTASDNAPADRFGEAVTVQQDRIFVGAPRNDDGATNAGAVYLFEFDESWTEIGKANPSDPSVDLAFGASLSVDVDALLVGAKYLGNSDHGAAYVFRHNGIAWLQESQLVPSDPEPSDAYGRSVTVAGDYAVVGADEHAEDGIAVGAAYVYALNATSWTQVAKVLASDGESGDDFGISVATYGSQLFVGAIAGSGETAQSGTVYIFNGLTDCNGNGAEDICDIATGASNDNDENGIPDDCECPWDLDGNSEVGISDLLDVLAAWGANPGGPPDFNGDGVVGIGDLITALSHWGTCPS